SFLIDQNRDLNSEGVALEINILITTPPNATPSELGRIAKTFFVSIVMPSLRDFDTPVIRLTFHCNLHPG
ncbi:MAG: hypothetical protein J7497_14725, partial [Chitinophagaceae bacterium]|nr:hypothetical protein [Chitinophagaceae bacterium]